MFIILGIAVAAVIVGALTSSSSGSEPGSIDASAVSDDPRPAKCRDLDPSSFYDVRFWQRGLNDPHWTEQSGRTHVELNRYWLCFDEGATTKGTTTYQPRLYRTKPGQAVTLVWASPVYYVRKDWAAGEGRIARDIFVKGLDPNTSDSPDGGLTSLAQQQRSYEFRGALWEP